MGPGLGFEWVPESLGVLAHGVLTTILLTCIVSPLGLLFSILGAAARRSHSSILRSLVGMYVELVRNTPFLAQLFFIFFALPRFGVSLDPASSAVLAMTINFAAYGTEIFGAGLDAVTRGQTEAALALGLRPRHVFLKVVLPQAVRAIFPALASQIVVTMLDTAAVSQISVRELTYEADLLQSRTFRAFETYLLVTVVYLGLSVALRRIVELCGRRFIGELA